MPCGIFQINWDSRDSVEEEVVFVEDLGVSVDAEKVHRSFRHENSISGCIACFGRHSGEKFFEKLSILRSTFDSDDFRGNFCEVATMTEASPVNFEGREDCGKLVTVGHGFELGGFEVGGEINRSFCIDLNQHELIDKILAKVSKVGDRGVDFGEVADGNWSIDAKTIGFDEDFRFLEPSKEVRVVAVELDVAK